MLLSHLVFQWTRKRIYVFNILHPSGWLSRSRWSQHTDIYNFSPTLRNLLSLGSIFPDYIVLLAEHLKEAISQLFPTSFGWPGCVHIQLGAGSSSSSHDSRLFLSPPLTSFEGYTKKSRWPHSRPRPPARLSVQMTSDGLISCDMRLPPIFLCVQEKKYNLLTHVYYTVEIVFLPTSTIFTQLLLKMIWKFMLCLYP